MTNNEIMKYGGYKTLIYINLIKISELESKATKCTASISDMPSSRGIGDPVGNADYDKISNLRDENTYFEQKIGEIEDFIESIQAPITKAIFRLRVFSRMGWWDIADTVAENSSIDSTAYSVKHKYYRYLEKSTPSGTSGTHGTQYSDKL